MRVIDIYLWVFLSDLIDRALPHTATVHQHIGLVDKGQLLTTGHSQLEGIADDALSTEAGIDGGWKDAG